MAQLSLKDALRLALSHHQADRLDEAEHLYRQILAVVPNQPDVLNLLGVLIHRRGDAARGAELIRRAIAIDPEKPGYHNNLGLALHEMEQTNAAEAEYRLAIELDPQAADAHNNLANLLQDASNISAAIEEYRVSIALSPENEEIHSNLIYAMHFDPAFEPMQIREEQNRWWSAHGEKFSGEIKPHENDRNPDRRLRVGYVSPDFFRQAECCFVTPLLENHDHEQVEVHCYASVAAPDNITERQRRAAHVWHDALGMSDAHLAAQIRADRIDILVDLTMHMARNRLTVFARKPAPLQVSWLAYPGSTGLPTIDYRLSDRFIDPVGEDSSWSSEIPYRLADCWCCYEPLDPVPFNELPALKNGFVTFGSLNNPNKNNDLVFDLWASALQGVPNSRLLMLKPVGEDRGRILSTFASRGVEASRIEFVPRMNLNDFWMAHHRIDIGLDTFPYNGITTTCDALWMGIPVLTSPGKWPASRACQGLLHAAGLSHLVQPSTKAFGDAAVALAGDVHALSELRRGLRATVSASPLCDGKRFAHAVEGAYREMWRKWVAQPN